MMNSNLSPGARAALLALTTDWSPPPSTTTRQAVAALAMRHSHLCEREWQDGCASSMYYRLTPLGQELATTLRAQAD